MWSIHAEEDHVNTIGGIRHVKSIIVDLFNPGTSFTRHGQSGIREAQILCAIPTSFFITDHLFSHVILILPLFINSEKI